VTEATFALPVFSHGDAKGEVAKLLRSLKQFPERAHVVGVYGLGKCQRLIALLREAGYAEPIYLHGALAGCCEVYESFGVELGALKPATGAKREEMKGAVVLAPLRPSADRWSRRMPDALTSFASGWMRVRARARQRGIELPLVISDHADCASSRGRFTRQARERCGSRMAARMRSCIIFNPRGGREGVGADRPRG